MRKPPRREHLQIDGPAGRIETLVEEPAADERENPPFAVICHPHPLHGGAMTNKVVHTLARAFNELGVIAVRFNFRGIGESEGHYDDGVGEVDDVVAVVDWAAGRWGSNHSLAGFSFGAAMALRAAALRPPQHLVTVAPPVDRLIDAAAPVPADLDWLIVQGARDELVDVDRVVEWLDTLQPGPRLVVMENADHFFHGALPELRQTIINDLRQDAVS
jgi:alpha/beta superfamily hydrolase